MRARVPGRGEGRRGMGVPAPPSPAPAAAVVRPIAMATCDLDRALGLGATPFPLPPRLGHEFVAEVLSAGAGVTSVLPGDRVVVPFQTSCGDCAPWPQRPTPEARTPPPLSRDWPVPSRCP